MIALVTQPCSKTAPGNYSAPGNIVALFYNGVLLPRGEAAPTLSYTATGQVATLNFSTGMEDRIDALCLL
jgi:hypothetical protein